MNTMYGINSDDAYFPKIIKLQEGIDYDELGMDENEDIMTFKEAKEKLVKKIKNIRDHWEEELKAAKKLKEKDV